MKNILLPLCLLFAIITCQGQSYPRIENTIRVMSYNVCNARGLDNVTDIQRVANVINNTLPDVVAIQELDSITNRSKQTDVLTRLAEFTKMYSVYGASIPYDGGKYGIGILSKEKPLSWKRIPLPGKEEPRSALIVEFATYIFCCTHLSLTEEDRQTSVTLINQAVAAYDKPVFLAGDINATPESPVLEAFKEKWTILNNPKQFTFPANQPTEAIDYIMGYNPKGYTYAVHQKVVVNEPVASDHRPIFVDVRLKADKAGIFRTPVYLQYPATDAMTVMWVTNVPCHSWVEFGTDSANMQRARTYIEGEAMANNTINRIRLTALKPGTKYYYRVCSREITLYEPYKKEFGETATSKVAAFTTLDNKHKDFTAIIFNDIHDRYPLFDKLYEQVKDVPYDIVFFNGDCIADVQSEDIALRTISHYSKSIGANVPSVYMRGNHETRGAYSMFLWNLLDRMGGHSYGAFNIGDTRFVLLDCGEDKPDDHWVYYDLNDFTQYRKDQAAFLRKEIASKEFKSASKRILIHHIPVYGMREESFNPSRDYWGDILSKANFNISLNGHTHRYNYLPKGTEGNNFPVVIGGGNNEDSATVMILRKTGKKTNLQVLNVKGETLLSIDI